jgi:hypothetical protein
MKYFQTSVMTFSTLHWDTSTQLLYSITEYTLPVFALGSDLDVLDETLAR